MADKEKIVVSDNQPVVERSGASVGTIIAIIVLIVLLLLLFGGSFWGNNDAGDPAPTQNNTTETQDTNTAPSPTPDAEDGTEPTTPTQ